MCGIYGYTGSDQAAEICLRGLKKIEYRGYDSAGIALASPTQMQIIKSVGNISNLNDRVQEHIEFARTCSTAIAHTRWATHGVPTKENAHPFTDPSGRIALIHNGIIENYLELKEELHHLLALEGKSPPTYSSQTDTEVVACFLGYYLEYKKIEPVNGNELLAALMVLLPKLKGSWAFAIIDIQKPNEILATVHELPLAIGLIEPDDVFQVQAGILSSDPYAIADQIPHCHFLQENQIALMAHDRLSIFDEIGNALPLQMQTLTYRETAAEKGSYESFTIKEIYDQPKALQKVLQGDAFTYNNGALSTFLQTFGSIDFIVIVACGTSYNAGVAAAYFFEEFAGIPTHVETASEFRYRHKALPQRTLAIAISQSGETADTLSAAASVKKRNIPVLAVCNVNESTLARQADALLPLYAGAEIGVCSTKAFTTQVLSLYLLALELAPSDLNNSIKEQSRELPQIAQEVLFLRPKIAQIAQEYAYAEAFFFIGRQYMYPAALEGALKLKELSYINCSAYPAGEIKHGPLALIAPDRPTIALCTHRATNRKMASNMMEIKAREGKIIAIGFEEDRDLFPMADHYLSIPLVADPLAVIPTSIALQLLACEIAMLRGRNIDQPRNLAKSITVE